MALMPSDVDFLVVHSKIYYQQTATYVGEVQPGVWERAALLSRLGAGRLGVLEATEIITRVAAQ